MRILRGKKDKKKKGKDSTNGENLVETDQTKNGHRPSSLYQYAINEYSNTVLPCQSNDDGSQTQVSMKHTPSLRANQYAPNNIYAPPSVISPKYGNNNSLPPRSPSTPSSKLNAPKSESNAVEQKSTLLPPPPPPPPQPLTHAQTHTSPVRVPVDGYDLPPRRNSLPSFAEESDDDTNIFPSRSAEWSTQSQFSPNNFTALTSIQPNNSELPIESPPNKNNSRSTNSKREHYNDLPSSPQPHSECSSPSFHGVSSPPSISQRYHIRRQQPAPPSSLEPEMPDSTYEEYYGDSYVSKPIRYIYPSGYGNMRPRSFPWKISVLICASFTWLTVFIVGHCSDQVNWDNYEYYEGEDGQEMDDEVVIATRWCGSRALYFMWVLSVLITGLACAYCSIIGYIKARDFAVANGRSQPPGMAGKSDFYVRIEENNADGMEQGRLGNGDARDGSVKGSMAKEASTKSIYQSDGTPRFLGSRIYRPTQAAVHLTSR